MTSSRPPAGLALGMAWGVYAVFLFFAYPLTPLAALAMVVPLVLTGWHARRWSVAAGVGLAHGAALAAVGWIIGAFSAWGPDALPLAMALVVLLSWALALSGWTLRIVHLLRWRTQDLDEARRRIEADAATVEAVYSASAAALVGLDTEGKIVSWNPGAAAVFGHPAAKAVGSSIDILAAPGHADDCSGRIRYVLDTGREMSTFSGKLRHADGHVLDVEVRPRSITHADGDRGALLTVVDRTREVVLGDEVARQAQRQDRIIHNLDEVLYSVAVPSMHPLMMSRTVEQLTGRDADDWNDFRQFMELAHPDDKEAVLQRWEHARSGEKSVLRWRLRTPLGTHAWVEDRVVPARDDEGRVVRVDGSIRRIFREVELERQAQRMMRWLDALEPMTGGGAWSVDLRNRSWQWSGGMRNILAMREEPEDGIDAWRARLDPASAQSFEHLLAHPENPHPYVLHIIDGAGQRQPFLMEPWVQRGADGEPIWLYGIVRPRQATTRGTRTRKAARPLEKEPAAGAQSAVVVSPTTARPLAIPPGSPLVGQHIGQALARARTAAEAMMAGEEADVLAGMNDAVAHAVDAASKWAQSPRTPSATKGIASDDIQAQVRMLADGAKRRAIDAVLATEQKAAEAAVVRAAESERRIQQHARDRIEAARLEADRQIEQARALAAQETAKARDAERARLEIHAEMERAIAEAQRAKARALEEAEAGRLEALQAADAARQQAEAHAAKSAREEAARVEAERAHQEALAAAEEAKAHARQEAERARAEALEQAEEAKLVAQKEATKAREAQQALEAAEAARREALAAAEEAKAHALHEAGKTRASALKAAEAAQERAEAEADKARRAEAARAKAEAASRQAAEAAEAAKAMALQDADKARSEAMEAAREAQEHASRQAAEARRAEQARHAAEEARAQALKQAEQANVRANQEEKARKQAIHEADRATAHAMAQAEEAMAAARLEAQRAEAAEQARLEAEEKGAAAVKQAEQAASQARNEAEAVKAEALEEAKRAQAAARAEAAKAEQAQKGLAAALKEAHKARDQAIHEAMKARDEAIRAANKARDEAMRDAAEARDEAMHLLAEAQGRVEQAEAEAEQAWAEARSQALAVVAKDAVQGQAQIQADEVVQAEWMAASEPDPEAWTADGMDVVWDDEIGWIPRPRGQQAKDKAEQIKAKSWQGGSPPKKGAGPWALD